MGTIRRPRRGSLAVWPRVRSKNETPRIRSWPSVAESKLLGFAGYKAGMTTIFITDNRKKSVTAGERIPVPVTVIECPPLRIASVRFYALPTPSAPETRVATEIFAGNDPLLTKKLPKHKKVSPDQAKAKLAKFKDKLSPFSFLFC